MSVPASSITSQTSGLPAYLSSAFERAAQHALDLSRRPYEPYAGQRIAPLAPAIGESLAMAGRTGSFAPAMAEAAHHIGRGSRGFPAGYKEYLDPYSQASMRGIAKQGKRTLKESILPELDARFIRLGQHGSSKHARLATRAARDIQKEISAKQEEELSKGYQQAMQGFNSDRARELDSGSLLSHLGMSQQTGQLADVQELREAGQLDQDQQQRLIDAAYEQWKEQQRHPYEALGQYFSVLHGTPYVPSTYTRTDIQRPSRPQSMHRGDWRDLGLGLATDFLFGRGR